MDLSSQYLKDWPKNPFFFRWYFSNLLVSMVITSTDMTDMKRSVETLNNLEW